MNDYRSEVRFLQQQVTQQNLLLSGLMNEVKLQSSKHYEANHNENMERKRLELLTLREESAKARLYLDSLKYVERGPPDISLDLDRLNNMQKEMLGVISGLGQQIPLALSNTGLKIIQQPGYNAPNLIVEGVANQAPGKPVSMKEPSVGVSGPGNGGLTPELINQLAAIMSQNNANANQLQTKKTEGEKSKISQRPEELKKLDSKVSIKKSDSLTSNLKKPSKIDGLSKNGLNSIKEADPHQDTDGISKQPTERSQASMRANKAAELPPQENKSLRKQISKVSALASPRETKGERSIKKIAEKKPEPKFKLKPVPESEARVPVPFNRATETVVVSIVCAKYLPDCAHFTKVFCYIVDALTGELQFPGFEKMCSIESDMYNPDFNLVFMPKVSKSSILMVYLLQADDSSETGSVLTGFSFLELFTSEKVTFNNLRKYS
jgi:hypothetical protein